MTDRAVLIGGLSIIAGALVMNSMQESAQSQTDVPVNAPSVTEVPPEEQVKQEYPEEIKHEIHSRVKTFFSEQGFSKLQDSFVIVSSTLFVVIWRKLTALSHLMPGCWSRRSR